MSQKFILGSNWPFTMDMGTTRITRVVLINQLMWFLESKGAIITNILLPNENIAYDVSMNGSLANAANLKIV